MENSGISTALLSYRWLSQAYVSKPDLAVNKFKMLLPMIESELSAASWLSGRLVAMVCSIQP